LCFRDVSFKGPGVPENSYGDTLYWDVPSPHRIHGNSSGFILHKGGYHYRNHITGLGGVYFTVLVPKISYFIKVDNIFIIRFII